MRANSPEDQSASSIRPEEQTQDEQTRQCCRPVEPHSDFTSADTHIDMADDSPRPSIADREGRRGSLARAFEKVRAAMKRRSSGVHNAQSPALTDASSQESVVRAVEPATIPRPVSTVLESANDEAIIAPTQPGATESTLETLAVDESIEVDDLDLDSEDLDEPLLPIPAPSGRTSLTPEKARELFAQHGLHYETRSKRPMQEPPAKIRRVEKPIRLRVHWTCHQCNTQFGMERICIECGHHRCLDCPQHPPKKVRELVDSTRLAFEQESIRREETPTPQEEDETEAGPAPRETAPPAVSSPIRLTGPLELDDGNESEGDADIRDFDFTTYSRPRAGVQTTLKPKAQLARRSCHICMTTIHPVTRNDCQNCGHLKCSHCPRLPQTWRKHAKSAHCSEEQSDEDEVLMVRAVQRVYRKPRQRVRYTCEHCDSLFIERDRCQGCGHERCTNCHREPPKRSATRHDPAILQAVADRLAAYGATLQQHSPRVTAGGA